MTDRKRDELVKERVRERVKAGMLELHLFQDKEGWAIDVTGCGLVSGATPATCLRHLSAMICDGERGE